jgi:Fe2+ transport system protein FeoA
MAGTDERAAAVIPLTRSRRGDRVEVVRLEGGWGIRQKLNQSGVYEGDVLTVSRRAIFGGPIVVEAHGSETAIGRGMARHIAVRKLA